MRAGRAWVVALAFCATMCAADDAVLIRNADVYPVTATVMKGVSLLIQDGKIVEIGAKVIAPKGAKIVEAKGMRVYPGMIDSGTTLGLSEIGAERVTVDTGELGEFMPQLKALIAVNPDSATFAVTRVNGITISGWGARRGWGWPWRRGASIHRRAGGIHPIVRLDLGRNGDSPQRGDAVEFSVYRGPRRTGRGRGGGSGIWPWTGSVHRSEAPIRSANQEN
jgi:hypothetical protein